MNNKALAIRGVVWVSASHVTERELGTLLEFSPSVYRIGSYNIPVGGSGYFRLFPLKMTLHCLRSINKKHNQPFMFYIHPWELDPDQPRLKAGWKSRFRHYQNLQTTERKLERLLNKVNFSSFSQSFDTELPTSVTTVTLCDPALNGVH